MTIELINTLVGNGLNSSAERLIMQLLPGQMKTRHMSTYHITLLDPQTVCNYFTFLG